MLMVYRDRRGKASQNNNKISFHKNKLTSLLLYLLKIFPSQNNYSILFKYCLIKQNVINLIKVGGERGP